eukprot:235381-Hanusia_phi.AAC.1
MSPIQKGVGAHYPPLISQSRSSAGLARRRESGRAAVTTTLSLCPGRASGSGIVQARPGHRPHQLGRL